jgi:RNA polymerase sigma-70 factor (ECF subfamily)
VAKPTLSVVPSTSDTGALEQRTDEELMKLARAGLTPAFRLLAERHTGRLVGFCSKFLSEVDAGREISQQVWLQVWAHRAAYESRDRFAVFLYTVAKNLCRNEIRRRARLGARVNTRAGDARLEALPSDDPGHLDALLLRERREELLRALATIPEPQREAMLLRFDQELSYEEMAAVLGASESTLRSRVYHGLRALRAALSRES